MIVVNRNHIEQKHASSAWAGDNQPPVYAYSIES